ncbi:hypothetical protein Prudu_013500 [Prunus dulcis]|uniref:Ubiquitin-like protease family profile domain-containing protein n=1 Tax=Prunus dulcis TaxID=3755 RepID=A0A4Y1RF96_PRUDU|nr:hypothetical protein Prudu_013500 [Prunus dulcis]
MEKELEERDCESQDMIDESVWNGSVSCLQNMIDQRITVKGLGKLIHHHLDLIMALRAQVKMSLDELQKQVSEGKVSVSGSNDVLTMALGPSIQADMLKPRISQSPKNPMSDKASCSGGDVRSLHFEDDTAKNGKHQEEKKNEGNQDEENNEEKKDEEKEEEKKDEEKKEEKQDEKEKEDEEKHDDQVIKVVDYSNMEAPSSLKSLCRYVETTLVPQDKTLHFTIDKEVFGLERDTFVLPEDITQFAGMEEIGATVVAVYMRYLHDLLKQANMCSMVGFIDPATVSANSGTIADRSRLVAARLQKTDGEQIFMMPYNPGRHWILLIVRAKRETVYFLDPLPGNRVVDEEGKNIVNSAIKIYNSHIARAGRKAVIWKTLSGTPKQPSSVECGYYVMRFMRDIIMDPSLAFEKKYAKGKQEAPYPKKQLMKSGMNGQSLFAFME